MTSHDAGSCVEWRKERRKLRCWQQLPYAFCNKPNVENHRHAGWERSWIQRRDDSGFANTLIRQLECEDTTEYKSMFRMDKEIELPIILWNFCTARTYMYTASACRALIEVRPGWLTWLTKFVTRFEQVADLVYDYFAQNLVADQAADQIELMEVGHKHTFSQSVMFTFVADYLLTSWRGCYRQFICSSARCFDSLSTMFFVIVF